MKAETKPFITLAYDLVNYDKVYIVLKPTAKLISESSSIVKFDKVKNKYFLVGKLIKKERKRLDPPSIVRYPKFRAIAFIDSTDVLAYRKERNEEKREGYILTIHFSDIECISVAFDSLDWKK
jgi:hypothetical protein